MSALFEVKQTVCIKVEKCREGTVSTFEERVSTVYDIREKNGNSQFLVYDSGWKWVYADECVPITEEDAS